MNKLNYGIFLLSIVIAPMLHAQTSMQLPEMEYITSLIEDEKHFEKLQNSTVFGNIKKEMPGAPLRLYAIIHAQSTEGGSASEFSSGLLAATTLGIIPVVKNQDIVMTYRIRINNNTLAEYSYTKNVTDVVSMYNMNKAQNFDKETQAWIDGTIDLLLEDIKKDRNIIEFIEEFDYYFGEEKSAD